MFAPLTKGAGNSDRLKESPSLSSTALKHPQNSATEHALMLQRTIGNQAVLRLLMPKLVVGQIDDPLESEADRVAEHVMRTSDPAAITPAGGDTVVQRKCEACEEEEQEAPVQLARFASQSAPLGHVPEAPAIVNEVLRSPGQPLEPSTRAFFEPKFGHDLSGIRIHTDSLAAESAESVGAHAYTVGRDIVFGENQYSPHAGGGGRLLAHELAHTIQQGATPANRAAGPKTGTVSTPRMVQRDPKVPPHDMFESVFEGLQVAEGAMVLGLDYLYGVPLTSEEMYELLLIRRAEPLSIPASQVNEADARIAEIDTKITAVDKEIKDVGAKLNTVQDQRKSARGSGKTVVALEIKKLQAQSAGLESKRKQFLADKVKFTRGRKLGTIGQGAPAGTGQITYAAIQVVDAQGKRIAIEFAETSADEHAEERIVGRLRATFKPDQLKGARITVVTDQKVCKDRCQRALIDFAKEFGVDLVESRYFVRPRIGRPGDASPRTTLVTSTKPSSADLPVTEKNEEIYRRPGFAPEPPKVSPSATDTTVDEPGGVRPPRIQGEPPHIPTGTRVRTAMMEAGANLVVDLVLDLLVSKYQKWRNDEDLRGRLEDLQDLITNYKENARQALLADPWSGGTSGYYYNIYLRIKSRTTTAIGGGRAVVIPGSLGRGGGGSAPQRCGGTHLPAQPEQAHLRGRAGGSAGSSTGSNRGCCQRDRYTVGGLFGTSPVNR